jgi:myo-inositol-1(or 4)-monophosphatase
MTQPPSPRNRDFADFACSLADAARRETLPRFESGVVAEDKNAGGAWDPVTDADRAAERAMRALIEYRYPNHGIAGEEFAERPARGPYVWSLDPIDGTRSFVCGLPTWTTLIALLEDGRPVIGVIDAPRLGERYVGHAGEARLIGPAGARLLGTSGCRSLGEARLSTTDPHLLDAPHAFERVRAACRTTRYGHDAYAYARLAAGSIDLVIESGLKPHDYNALVPVVRAAGGTIGNWRGESDLSAGSIVAAATAQLFEAAVEALAVASA